MWEIIGTLVVFVDDENIVLGIVDAESTENTGDSEDDEDSGEQ